MPGARFTGKVERHEKFGVFVFLAPGRTGLVPLSETGVAKDADLAAPVVARDQQPLVAERGYRHASGLGERVAHRWQDRHEMDAKKKREANAPRTTTTPPLPHRGRQRVRGGAAGQPTLCSQRTGAPSPAYRKGSSSSSQSVPSSSSTIQSPLVSWRSSPLPSAGTV